MELFAKLSLYRLSERAHLPHFQYSYWITDKCTKFMLF